MTKRLVLILWIVAFALTGLVYYVKSSQSTQTKSHTKRSAGQTLLEKFPSADVAAITVTGADGTTQLAKKDGKWTVANRDSYPANTPNVNELIRTITDLKVVDAIEAAPQFAPRFGMDDSAAKAEDRGLTVSFANASGTELTKVSLGKSLGGDEAANPMGGGATGRFVRNHGDETGIYKISEMFGSLASDPKSWLASDFIQIEKPKSVAVTQPGKADLAWKLSRPDEEANFALEGATEADKFDANSATPLKTLFSFGRFEDVVPAAEVEKRIEADKKRVATVETVEGFTYTLNISPAKSNDPAPAAGEPPAAAAYFLTVDVAAELPKERKKAADEKPEDAKAKDEAFQTRLKALQEKLVKEQALKGRTFQVRENVIEDLLKARDGFKAAPAPQGQGQGMPQGFPPGMMMPPGAQPGRPAGPQRVPVEAVTPPVSVPAEGDDQ